MDSFDYFDRLELLSPFNKLFSDSIIFNCFLCSYRHLGKRVISNKSKIFLKINPTRVTIHEFDIYFLSVKPNSHGDTIV